MLPLQSSCLTVIPHINRTAHTYVHHTEKAYEIIAVVIRDILIRNPVAGVYSERHCALRHQIVHALDLPGCWHLTHFHITGNTIIGLDEILRHQLRLLQMPLEQQHTQSVPRIYTGWHTKHRTRTKSRIIKTTLPGAEW